MFQLEACVLGFEHLKAWYDKGKDFGESYADCAKHPNRDFLIQEGFLFKGTWLCVPKCTTRELLIRDVHGGSLAGYYGENKTLSMLREHYH